MRVVWYLPVLNFWSKMLLEHQKEHRERLLMGIINYIAILYLLANRCLHMWQNLVARLWERRPRGVIYLTEPNINEWSNWLRSVPQHPFWEWTEWRYGGAALKERNLVDMVESSSWWGMHPLDWLCFGDALFGHVPALPDSSLTHPIRSILKRNNSVFLTRGQSRDIWPRRVDQTYSHGREHSLLNFRSKTLTGLYFIKYGFHSIFTWNL